jgi:endonuclease III
MKKSEFTDLYQKVLKCNHDELENTLKSIQLPTTQSEVAGYIAKIIVASNNMNAQILFDTIINLGIIEDDE